MATSIFDRGKSWRAQVRRAGFPSKSKTFQTKQEAKAWSRKREAELDTMSPTQSRAAHGRRVKHVLNVYAKERCGFALQFEVGEQLFYLSPREALARFDKDKANEQDNVERANTWRGLVTYLEFWHERIGEIPLAKLTRDDIVAQLDVLSDLTRKSQDDYHRVLQAAFNCVVNSRRENWLTSNPAAFDKLGGYVERDRVLNVEEEAALIEALAENDRLRLIVRIGLATGLRRGNILGLTWKHIDLTTGETFVPVTKNGGAITTRITGEALRELKTWSKVRQIGSDFVFPASRGVNAMAWPRKEWLAALQAAGIPNQGDPKADKHTDPASYWGFRFHDLRHTCATRLMDAGATQFEISAVMGHKTAQMTKRYIRDSVTHIDNAFARLGAS